MLVLGYNGGIEGYISDFGVGHDASAAVVIDGEVVAACQEERFNREKHSHRFPIEAMRYCLKEAGATFDDVDVVAYFWSFPQMYAPAMWDERHAQLKPLERLGFWGSMRALKGLNQVLGYGDKRTLNLFRKHTSQDRWPVEKLVSLPHHICPAASTFYDSPFDEALSFTLDGGGESTSCQVDLCRGTDIEVTDEIALPNSPRGRGRAGADRGGGGQRALPPVDLGV